MIDKTLIAQFSPKNITAREIILLVCFGLGVPLVILTFGNTLGIGTELVSSSALQLMLVLLVSMAIVTPLHEGMHGLFFKIFTGKAIFGATFRTKLGLVFWASSPDSLIPRVRFQIIALAPQALTVLFLLVAVLMPLPDKMAYTLLIMAALNLSGGCIDLWGAMWLRNFPKSCLIEDTKDGCNVFIVRNGYGEV